VQLGSAVKSCGGYGEVRTISVSLLSAAGMVAFSVTIIAIIVVLGGGENMLESDQTHGCDSISGRSL
jgi:hypothetical protein